MLRRRVGVAAVAATVAFLLVTATVIVGSESAWPGQALATSFFSLTESLPLLIGIDRALDVIGGDAVLAVVVVLVAATLLLTKHFALGAYLVLSSLASVMAVAVTKSVVASPRPPTMGVLLEVSSLSYPSGHASAGIAVVGALGVVCLALRASGLIRVVGWIVIILGLVVGLSRLSLGVHWLADVLGGWLIGLAVTCAAGWVVLEFVTRRSQRTADRF